jgi:hypothetical protein
MSEGCYVDGKYVPWTTDLILDAADSEVGPGCCDASYQKLRDAMEAAPGLLEALTMLESTCDSGLAFDHPIRRYARSEITKARGEA